MINGKGKGKGRVEGKRDVMAYFFFFSSTFPKNQGSKREVIWKMARKKGER